MSLVLVTAGCGGDDGKQAPAGTTPPGTTEPQTAGQGATAPGRTTRSPNARKGTGPKARRVDRYLRKHYSSGISASDAWYGHVGGVTVAGTTTTLTTDLSNDPDGRALAQQICVSVRGSIPGLTDSVHVRGAAGDTLAGCVP